MLAEALDPGVDVLLRVADPVSDWRDLELACGDVEVAAGAVHDLFDDDGEDGRSSGRVVGLVKNVWPVHRHGMRGRHALLERRESDPRGDNAKRECGRLALRRVYVGRRKWRQIARRLRVRDVQAGQNISY